MLLNNCKNMTILLINFKNSSMRTVILIHILWNRIRSYKNVMNKRFKKSDSYKISLNSNKNSK